MPGNRLTLAPGLVSSTTRVSTPPDPGEQGPMSTTTPAVHALGHRRPKYLAIALTWLQQAIAYRVTTLFTVVITFIWVFILYALWEAAFADTGRIAGYSWAHPQRARARMAHGSRRVATADSGGVREVHSRSLQQCAVEPRCSAVMGSGSTWC